MAFPFSLFTVPMQRRRATARAAAARTGGDAGGDAGGAAATVAASGSAYDDSAFQAHVRALAQSDEEVLKACAIAAGRHNLASKQADIRRHLEAAVELGHEYAQDLLDDITQNPQATAEILTSFKKVMDTLKSASAMGLAENGAALSLQDKQSFAAMLYRRAAVLGQEGSFEAMSCYGKRLEAGAGVRANPKAALMWLRHGAESGNFDCMVQYALSLMKSESTQKEGWMWYKKAADAGNAGAQVNLGMCYEQGTAVKKDMKQALFWYEKAAAQNHPIGLKNTANCHTEGWGTKKDPAAGAAWLRRGAEAGVALAQGRLACCYEKGRGVEKSWEQAVYWYRKAAEQGEVISQFNLGNCYYNGWGVEVDEDQAALWYGRAALQGLQQASLAIVRYGLKMFDEATLLGLTREEAYAGHLEAAQAGDADAMVQTANCLFTGDGVERNFAEGRDWLVQAAEAGSGEAVAGLADIWMGNKPGLRKEELSGVKALELYEKAEELGYDCTNQVANIYMKGAVGVPRDGEKAVAILRSALARSHVIPSYKATADLNAHVSGDHEAGSKAASDAAVAAGVPINITVEAIRLVHYNLAQMLEFGFGCRQNLAAAKYQYASAADRVPLADARLTEIELTEAEGASDPKFAESDDSDKDEDEGKRPKIKVGTRTKANGSTQIVIDPPTPADWVEVVKAYREGAEAGDEEAMYFLGSVYERGVPGVEKDLSKAKELYAASAAKGVWWAEQAVARLGREKGGAKRRESARPLRSRGGRSGDAEGSGAAPAAATSSSRTTQRREQESSQSRRNKAKLGQK